MKLSVLLVSAKRRAWLHFLIVAFLFLIFFLFYFRSILFSNYFISIDGIIPADLKIAPWSSSVFSGYPLISDPTFFILSPVRKIIYQLLKLDFNFFIISGYFLMAFFTYCYVHYLTRSKASALLSAISYSFSGYAIFEIGHAAIFIQTICWLPLILLCLENLKERFALNWAILCLLAIPTSVTAGFPQLSIAMLPIIMSYALLLSYQTNTKFKKAYFYFFLIAGGYLIAAPVVIPAYVLSQFSDRLQLTWDFFCSYYVEFKQLLLFQFPYLMGGYYGLFAAPPFGSWEIVGNHGYVGFLSLILAGIAIFKHSQKLKLVVYFWLIFTLLTLLTALGPGVKFFYEILFHLPVINHFRAPERYLFIFAFGISVLAGIGLSTIRTHTNKLQLKKKPILILSLLFACLLLISVISIYPSLIKDALKIGWQLTAWYKNPAVMVPCLWIFFSLLSLWLLLAFPCSRLSCALLVAIACGEVLYTAYFSYWHPANDGSTKNDFFHPPNYLAALRSDLNHTKQRYLKMQISQDNLGQYLWGNYPIYFNLPSAGGYAPLAIKDYTDFLAITNYGAYISSNLSDNQAINIAGIKYLFTVANFPLNTSWFANKKQFKLRNTIGDTLVYENLHALPRVWFTAKVAALPKNEMLQVIHTGKFLNGKLFNPAHIALVDQPIQQEFQEDKTAQATIVKMNDKAITIQTHTNKTLFLVLSDIYYPGWYAYLDGRKSKFYQTDYIYRGIIVPVGEHRIVYKYRPFYLYISYAISGIAFLMQICLLFYWRKKFTRE